MTDEKNNLILVSHEKKLAWGIAYPHPYKLNGQSLLIDERG